jgi:hypothetical protein
VFDLMTKWIERYRKQAEERFSRLDAVLAGLDDDKDDAAMRSAASAASAAGADARDRSDRDQRGEGS